MGRAGERTLSRHASFYYQECKAPEGEVFEAFGQHGIVGDACWTCLPNPGSRLLFSLSYPPLLEALHDRLDDQMPAVDQDEQKDLERQRDRDRWKHHHAHR
jgi:hypothetical protein